MSPFYEQDRRRSRHFIPLFLLSSIHTFMIRFGPLARAIMMTVFKKRQGMYGLKIHNPIVPGDWFDAEYSEDRWYLAIVMSTNQYSNSVLVHFQATPDDTRHTIQVVASHSSAPASHIQVVSSHTSAYMSPSAMTPVSVRMATPQVSSFAPAPAVSHVTTSVHPTDGGQVHVITHVTQPSSTGGRIIMAYRFDQSNPLSMLLGLLQAAVNSVHPEGSAMFFHPHALSEALPMSTRFGDFFLTVGGEMHLVTVLIGQCGHVEAGGKYLQSHQEHVRGNAGAAGSRPSKNKQQFATASDNEDAFFDKLLFVLKKKKKKK
eukprot:356773_1